MSKEKVREPIKITDNIAITAGGEYGIGKVSGYLEIYYFGKRIYMEINNDARISYLEDGYNQQTKHSKVENMVSSEYMDCMLDALANIAVMDRYARNDIDTVISCLEDGMRETCDGNYIRDTFKSKCIDLESEYRSKHGTK